jgi:hypothetical protein
MRDVSNRWPWLKNSRKFISFKSTENVVVMLDRIVPGTIWNSFVKEVGILNCLKTLAQHAAIAHCYAYVHYRPESGAGGIWETDFERRREEQI